MDEKTPAGRILRRLRLRHIELLAVLQDSESLRVASDRLHLSQPAISKMLKEIESSFGGTLFTRSKTGIRATAAGEVAMRQARVICNEIESTAGEVLAALEGRHRALRLGSLTVTSIVPKAIGRYRSLNRGAKVHLREASVDVLLNDLLENNIDCVVGALSLDIASKPLIDSLSITPVARDWICLVCSPRHALASRRKVSWSELQAFDWILPPPHTMLRQVFVSGCLQRGFEPPAPTIESMSPLTLSQLIKADNTLIGVVRKEQIRGEMSPSTLHELPLDPPIELPALSFITRRSTSAPTAAVQGFLSALQAVAAHASVP